MKILFLYTYKKNRKSRACLDWKNIDISAKSLTNFLMLILFTCKNTGFLFFALFYILFIKLFNFSCLFKKYVFSKQC